MGQNTQRSKRVEGKTKEAHRNTETCMVFKNSNLLYKKKPQIWKTDFELNGSVRQEIKLKS